VFAGPELGEPVSTTFLWNPRNMHFDYSYVSGRDPVAAVKSTDKLFQADISFNF
jgi:hypothetical protein